MYIKTNYMVGTAFDEATGRIKFPDDLSLVEIKNDLSAIFGTTSANMSPEELANIQLMAVQAGTTTFGNINEADEKRREGIEAAAKLIRASARSSAIYNPGPFAHSTRDFSNVDLDAIGETIFVNDENQLVDEEGKFVTAEQRMTMDNNTGMTSMYSSPEEDLTYKMLDNYLYAFEEGAELDMSKIPLHIQQIAEDKGIINPTAADFIRIGEQDTSYYNEDNTLKGGGEIKGLTSQPDNTPAPKPEEQNLTID